jgi:phosphocarrier protein HPr
MSSRTVTVGSRSGLHARPAALFVAAAAALLPVRVTIRTDGKSAVPAHSMLSVLSLGATCGTEVVLEADGAGAEAALTSLADLLARDLDAEETAAETAKKPAEVTTEKPETAEERADA